MTGGWIMARLRARSLDDKLLSGSTDGDPVLLLRRTRLLHHRYRSAVARALRRVLDEARRSQANRYVAKLPLMVREILGSGPLILTLADELEHEETVSPRGVILADRLVTDGHSPVYVPTPSGHRSAQTVESAVKHARAALHLG